MPSKVKCPICGSELTNFTKGHIDTKKHQAALKKKDISPSEDPALKLLKKKTQTQPVKKQITKGIEARVVKLETIVNQIKENQGIILKILDSLNIKKINVLKKKSLKPTKKLKIEDIRSAIAKCVQNNKNESLWVKLDDVISILKLNREDDRIALNKSLILMFNKNIIDLAEGGDPKYSLKYQNREYGMIALQ